MSYRNLEEKVERFCFLDRKQLNEYWQCVLTGHSLICRKWCKKCGCFKELEVIREELKESWFFSSRNDHNYQPVLWIIFFKNENVNLNFRIEIEKIAKSDKIVDKMGRTVPRFCIVDLLNQLYINQENNCYFCIKSCCIFFITADSLEKQLRNEKFGTENSKVEN